MRQMCKQRFACIVKTATARGGKKSFTHMEHRVPGWLAERVWGTKFQSSSLLNTYFCRCVFQASILLIYFRDGPSRCSYCSNVWDRTYPICAGMVGTYPQTSVFENLRFYCPNSDARPINSYEMDMMLSENAFLSTGSLGQTHCNRLKVLILVKDEMHLPKQKEPQITLADYMVNK